MSTDPLDLAGLLVAIFALIVSKEVATILGPYAGIIVLACAGAAVALSGSDRKMTAREACWYFTWRAFVAAAATVMIAELLQIVAAKVGLLDLKPRYTVAPIAFLIGWVKDYNTLLRSALDLVARVLQRKVDGK